MRKGAFSVWAVKEKIMEGRDRTGETWRDAGWETESEKETDGRSELETQRYLRREKRGRNR